MNIRNTQFPKVLIIDPTAMGNGSATGELKSAYFSEFPPECLLHLRATAQDGYILDIPGQRSQICNGDLGRVMKACEAFRPDVILYRCVGDKDGLHEAALSILARLGRPYFVWLMDDWPDRLRRSDPRHFMIIDRDLRALLSRATRCYAISELMAEAFQARYGCKFAVLRNGVNKQEWSSGQSSPEGADLLIRYSGSLAPDMTRDSVLDLSCAVSELNEEGQNIKLEIRTHKWWFEQEKSKFKKLKNVDLNVSQLSRADYIKWLSNADVVFVGYNFDRDTEAYIKYSFANKIPECLAADAAVLAYGPSSISSIKILSEIPSVSVIDERDTERLKHKLKWMNENRTLIRKQADESRKFAHENFNLEKQKETFLADVRYAAGLAAQSMATLESFSKNKNSKIAIGKKLRSSFANEAQLSLVPENKAHNRFNIKSLVKSYIDDYNKDVFCINASNEEHDISKLFRQKCWCIININSSTEGNGNPNSYNVNINDIENNDLNESLNSIGVNKADLFYNCVLKINNINIFVKEESLFIEEIISQEKINQTINKLKPLNCNIFILSGSLGENKELFWDGFEKFNDHKKYENAVYIIAFMGSISERQLYAALDKATQSDFRSVQNSSALNVGLNDESTLVILGNGPSLKSININKIKYDTLGMNAAYRYWNRINWWPTLYACLDTVVGVSHKDEIIKLIEKSNENGIRKFILRDNLISQLGPLQNSGKIINFDRFEGAHLSEPINPITTGSHSALWAAIHGYRRILIAGVDSDYVERLPISKISGKDELLVTREGKNPNYFFEDYQQPGDRYRLPNPRPNLHRTAWRRVARKLGGLKVEAFNVNLKSKMDAFDYAELSAKGALSGRTEEASRVYSHDDQTLLVDDPDGHSSAIAFLTAYLDEAGTIRCDRKKHRVVNLASKYGWWRTSHHQSDVQMVIDYNNQSVLNDAMESSRKGIIVTSIQDPVTAAGISKMLWKQFECVLVFSRKDSGQICLTEYPCQFLLVGCDIIGINGDLPSHEQLQDCLLASTKKSLQKSPVGLFKLRCRSMVSKVDASVSRKMRTMSEKHNKMSPILNFGHWLFLVVRKRFLLLITPIILISAVTLYLFNLDSDLKSQLIIANVACYSFLLLVFLILYLRNRMNVFRAEVAAQVSNLNNKLSAVDKININHFNELNQKNKKNDELISDLQEFYKEQSDFMNTTYSTIHKIENEMPNDIVNIKRNIGSLKGQQTRLWSSLSDLKNKTNDDSVIIDEKIASNFENMNQLESSIQHIEATINELSEVNKGLFESLQNSINEVDTRTNKNQDAIISIQDSILTSQNVLEIIQNTMMDVSKTVEDYKNEVTRIKTQSSKIEEQVGRTSTVQQHHNNLFRKMGSTNAAQSQPFPRYLAPAAVQKLKTDWLPRFGILEGSVNLSYLAHQICLIEDRCQGRLAGQIERAVLRTLALHSLSTHTDHLNVLEIGTLFGIGGISLSKLSNVPVHLTLLDPLEGYYLNQGADPYTGVEVSREVLESNLDAVGLTPETYKIIQGMSEDPDIIKNASKKKYDYILIDGDHSYEGVKRDFDNYAPFVKNGGLIIFDDYGSDDWPDVEKVAKEALRQHSNSWEWVGDEWATGIMKKKKSRTKN